MSATTAFAKLSVTIRDVYLQTTLVEAFMHGIFTVVISLTIYAVLVRGQKSNYSMTGAIILMYTLSTIHIGNRWNIIRHAYVFHGQTEDTILDYLLFPPSWPALLGDTVFIANTLVADCIVIWRCWVIWNRNWRIMLVPMLSLITEIAFGIGELIQQAKPSTFNVASHLLVNWSTPYFSLSVFTTLLSTLLIVFRISVVTRRNETIPGLSSYRRIIEIVVESATLYSATSIIFLILYARNDFNRTYPEAMLAQITGIAPTLIVTRVSFGLARPEGSWTTSESGASIQFNPMSTASGPATEPSTMSVTPGYPKLGTTLTMENESGASELNV